MTAFDIYHSLTTSAQSKTNEKPLCWARCPGLLRVIRGLNPLESMGTDRCHHSNENQSLLKRLLRHTDNI